MLYLQRFREDIDPTFTRENPVVFPKSVTVNQTLSMYGQKIRNGKDVLDKLQLAITYPFVNNPHKSLLCFKNGLVDLKTGKRIGPAAPDLLITQFVPHDYDENADTTMVAQKIQTCFPEECYPGESIKMLDFYRRWCGYSITGDTSEQKALFVIGRGSNGKSALGSITGRVWGTDLCKAVDSAHFQEGVGSNNDNVFEARNVRSIILSETADNKKVSVVGLAWCEAPFAY